MGAWCAMSYGLAPSAGSWASRFAAGSLEWVDIARIRAFCALGRSNNHS